MEEAVLNEVGTETRIDIEDLLNSLEDNECIEMCGFIDAVDAI